MARVEKVPLLAPKPLHDGGVVLGEFQQGPDDKPPPPGQVALHIGKDSDWHLRGWMSTAVLVMGAMFAIFASLRHWSMPVAFFIVGYLIYLAESFFSPDFRALRSLRDSAGTSGYLAQLKQQKPECV